MNGLISFENISVRPVTEEILALNEVSSAYGLVLTEAEAKELSETRNRAIIENERVEMGFGAVKSIIERFCQSRYAKNGEEYANILNRVTDLFYFIKTETDDRICDGELIEELYKRFELNCRGSIDTLESREAERIIRMVNSGENYRKWYKDRDELDYTPQAGAREIEGSVLRDTYGDEFYGEASVDQRYYEPDVFDKPGEENASSLDAFDEFFDLAELFKRAEKTDSGLIRDEDDEEKKEDPQ